MSRRDEWIERLHMMSRSSLADLTPKECGELRDLLVDAAIDEREACAALADEEFASSRRLGLERETAARIGAAIRARGGQ